MKLYTCDKCKTSIKLSFIKGNTHIVCPKCHQAYQFDEPSIKKYMLIPLLSVGFSVATSLRFLKGQTIDVKFIYIIGVSFLLAALLEYACVKAGILTYEKSKKR